MTVCGGGGKMSALGMNRARLLSARAMSEAQTAERGTACLARVVAPRCAAGRGRLAVAAAGGGRAGQVQTLEQLTSVGDV